MTTRGGHRTVITTALSLASNTSDTTFIAHQDDYGEVLVGGFNMETYCMVAAQAKWYGILASRIVTLSCQTVGT
jgi:hypothetical protein